MRSETPADPTYGYTAHLPAVSFEDARSRVTDALKQQGFGILTEIDVTATLKAKLNFDFRRYVILGACNPQLAHRALEAELAGQRGYISKGKEQQVCTDETEACWQQNRRSFHIITAK